MKAQDLLPPQLEEFEDPADPQLEAATELEEVARHLDLEPWILQRLLHPERELTTNLVIARDSCEPAVFTGYRIQHFTSRGPTLGGVSFSQHAYLAGVRASAMQATWQSALLNLPFGGAAGAIVCNPDELSEDELRQLSKDYAHALRGIIGRFEDVLAPGLGCHAQTIAWMMDSIAHDSGRIDPGAATGKPESMYGLPDYTGMTTLGIVVLIEELLGCKQSKLAGQRISVQGFGALGSSIARALHDLGAMIIAVADISGGVYDSAGIDVIELQKHVGEHGLIYGLESAEAVQNADILEADCDVLITAASERQISVTNVARIKAPIVIEATKWAVTSGAEQALSSRKTVVIPEMLTTGGAAIAAFLEWNQSARFSTMSAEEARLELTKRMTAALDHVLATAEKNSITLRRAAHVIAIDRIASEMRLRK